MPEDDRAQYRAWDKRRAGACNHPLLQDHSSNELVLGGGASDTEPDLGEIRNAGSTSVEDVVSENSGGLSNGSIAFSYSRDRRRLMCWDSRTYQVREVALDAVELPVSGKVAQLFACAPGGGEGGVKTVDKLELVLSNRHKQSVNAFYCRGNIHPW